MKWLCLASYVMTASAEELSHHLQQAEHFFRREWYDDAEAEYQTALGLPGGNDNLALHDLGARIAWARLDIEAAMTRFQLVAALTPDETQARMARQRAEDYARNFGFIEISGRRDGQRRSVSITSESPILDPELSTYARAIGERLASPVELPLRLALPVGTWTIEGRTVRISAGAEHDLSLEEPRNQSHIDGLEVHSTTGLGIWLEGGTPEGTASPQFELGLSYPLGALRLNAALSLDWYRKTTSIPIERNSGPCPGFQIGATRRIPVAGAISLQPNLQVGLYRTDSRRISETIRSNPGFEAGLRLQTHEASLDTPLGAGIGLSLEYRWTRPKGNTMNEIDDWLGTEPHALRLLLQSSISWKF